MISKHFKLATAISCGLLASTFVASQTLPPQSNVSTPMATVDGRDGKGINEWLLRMHEASKKQSYVGTYMVSIGGQMQSAKIWHVCESGQQVERVDTLTGAPRSSFRHNDKLVTFLLEQKVVRHEKREALGTFPMLVQSADNRIAEFYQLKPEGVERVAGLEADVALLLPKDRLRFGYRVWTEQKKGLIVKLQTLDAEGKVLEQAAFSELQLDAPVSMDKLLRMMGKADGYRMEQSPLIKTSADAEGWVLKTPVAGFKPVSCFKRPLAKSQNVQANLGIGEPMQWVFSDGLASVSLFVEPFDTQRHIKESILSLGATNTLTRQLGGYWLTAVGEVPAATLKQFTSGLERSK